MAATLGSAAIASADLGGTALAAIDLGGAQIWPTGDAPAEQTVVLAPTDDAYLEGSTRHNNQFLKVEANKRVSYLKFDLSAVDGEITSAVLGLRHDASIDVQGSGTLSVNLGDSNAWTEDDLSSANAPAPGALLGDLGGTFHSGLFYEVPLSGLVPGAINSLVLRFSTVTDAWFSSKEGTEPPKLTVTHLGASDDEPAGEPWADGTFWTDNYGWKDN